MKSSLKVALISMPFFSTKRPSIQIGLLKAIAENAGAEVTNFSFNLDFAMKVGLSLYEKLSRHRGRLIGDWLFSKEAFGEKSPDPDCSFLADVYQELPFLLDESADKMDELIKKLLIIRENTIPEFIEELSDREEWNDVDVVGFTSTFQQTTASLALARSLKQKYPHIVTIFGGANFDGEMGIELLQKNNAIDFICVGEGDQSFPTFLKELITGGDTSRIKGILNRSNANDISFRYGVAENISNNPIPDYDEFFIRSKDLGLISDKQVRNIDIPFESSRGCWWGQKHHCTFCGLNGTTMNFRRKDPEKVLNELFLQADKYQTFNFEAVDNIIDMNYLTSLFPVLQQNNYSYNFFYETKANLTKDQIKLLSESGVKRIQPGIESFSPNVLKIMDKGVKAIQNIFLLKWCAHYKMHVMWNVIWGFPGEKKEDYNMQAELIPFLYHYQPPIGGFRIWLERFSPLFFDNEKYKKKHITPDISYRYIYPNDHNLEQIAYFFHYEFEDELHNDVYQPLLGEINSWQKQWENNAGRPELLMKSSQKYIEITDTRNATKCYYDLHNEEAAIYQFCSDHYRSLTMIESEFASIDPAILKNILDSFINRKIMVGIDKYYLSLALPHSYPF